MRDVTALLLYETWGASSEVFLTRALLARALNVLTQPTVVAPLFLAGVIA